MLRKQARLRREYLYRRSLDGRDADEYEKKRKLRKALADGKPVPADLRDDAHALQDAMRFDDVATAERRSLVDDEYASAAYADPKVFITTSRDPSSRLAQFAKELRLIFPNAQRLNRGNHVVKQLVDACRANECTDLVIVHEHRGEPDGLIVSHLPHGPTAYFGLHNCVLRHDIRTREAAPQEYPHLVFHHMNTKLGVRLQCVLRHLFPVPKDDSHRVVTFANDVAADDTISMRHHVYKKHPGGSRDAVELKEIGPRFEMRLYQLKLGALDTEDTAEVEWALKPFMNSATKRSALYEAAADDDEKA